MIPTAPPSQNLLISRVNKQGKGHGDAPLSDEDLLDRGWIQAAARERFDHWIRGNRGLIDIFLQHGLPLDAQNDILRNSEAPWLVWQMRSNFEK